MGSFCYNPRRILSNDKRKRAFHASFYTKQETSSSLTIFFSLGKGLCCAAKASLEEQLYSKAKKTCLHLRKESYHSTFLKESRKQIFILTPSSIFPVFRLTEIIFSSCSVPAKLYYLLTRFN